MIRDRTLQARHKLVSKLLATGELLRGSLLERTVRHTKDCPKCTWRGHRVFVVTVTYAAVRSVALAPNTVEQRSENINFAPGSSLVPAARIADAP